MGFAAAELLNHMMQGKRPPNGPTLIAPLGVVVRQSSDVVAIEDAAVSAAVRFIREHATRGIGVDDVLKAVHISRSSLERRMRRLLGRSPNAEINRVRLDHVQKLLAETDLPLEVIAHKSGFLYQQYLAELFKRTFGESPGTWRRRHRHR